MGIEWFKVACGFFRNSLPNDINLRLDQIETICRRQDKCDSEVEVCFGEDRKGKRENACCQDFLLFPRCFQTRGP